MIKAMWTDAAIRAASGINLYRRNGFQNWQLAGRTEAKNLSDLRAAMNKAASQAKPEVMAFIYFDSGESCAVTIDEL